LDLKNKPDYNGNVVEFARTQTMEALHQVEQMIARRNEHMAEIIDSFKFKKASVVIGALHIEDLKEKLEKKDIKVTVVEDPQAKKELAALDILNQFKEILMQREPMQVVYYQVPNDLDVSKFPFGNSIKNNLMMTDAEEKSLLKIIEANKLNPQILTSDFDKDGIRDFTLSQGEMNLVISAEDEDWDNDGILNLLDNTVGEVAIAPKVKPAEVSNIFEIKEYSVDQFKKKHDEQLLSSAGEKIDLLVLKVYEEIRKVYKKKLKIKHLHATRSSVQYGSDVFFSYVPQSQTLEIYTTKLMSYLERYRLRNFKGVEMTRYLNDVITPMLIHSLSHEMAHASSMNALSYAKNFGWSWDESDYKGKYLYENRIDSKKIAVFKNDIRFRGKRSGQWMSEKLLVEKERLQLKNPKFKQAVQQSIWYTNVKTTQELYWLSLLAKYNVVSYYAFKSPEEWFAENFAACLFQKFYPKSAKKLESLKYEWLIGLYPMGAPKNMCSDLWR
jgi:hypothetical protein